MIDLRNMRGGMRILAVLGATLLGAGFLGGCAPTLAGALVDEAGLPVGGADARVNIIPVLSGEAVTTTVVPVEPDGEFKVSEALPPGEYLIEALVPGYSVASTRMKLAGKDQVRMTMKATGAAKVNTIGVNEAGDTGRGAGGVMLMPPSL